MNRRSFLLGLAAGLAPAVIRTPGLLMPVRALVRPDWFQRGPVVAQEEMDNSLLDFIDTEKLLIAQGFGRYMVGWSDWRVLGSGHPWEWAAAHAPIDEG